MIITPVRLRLPLLVCMVAMLCPVVAAAEAKADDHAWRHALGVSAGNPQVVALSYERAFSSRYRGQLNVGSMPPIVASVNGRLIYLLRQGRWRPYVSAGLGWAHAWGTDTGSTAGPSNYGWLAAGLRVDIGRLVVFAEFGALPGLREDRGLPDEVPVVATGLLWTFD